MLKMLNIFKQRVRDVFTQTWHSRLENSTRARCFLTFADFKYQEYLDVLNIMKYRKSLVAFDYLHIDLK